MGRGDLQLCVTHDEDETVVALQGELDMATAPELTAVVADLLSREPGRVVLDLSELTFCDSRGLGTLIVLSRAAQTQRTYLLLRRPGPFFTRMLDVTGLRSGLNILEP